MSTRGERNNNPGNIDYNPRIHWIGLVGIEPKVGADEPRFCLFDSALNGIRAIARIFRSYQAEGLRTPALMLSKYAPGIENDTNAYIDFWCRETGLAPFEAFTLTPKNAYRGVDAIIRFENGRNIYSETLVSSAILKAW